MILCILNNFMHLKGKNMILCILKGKKYDFMHFERQHAFQNA